MSVSQVTVSSSWRLDAEIRLRQRCLRELQQQRPRGWRRLCLLTRLEIALLPLRRIARRSRAALLRLAAPASGSLGRR